MLTPSIVLLPQRSMRCMQPHVWSLYNSASRQFFDAHICHICMAVPLPGCARCIQMQCLHGSASPQFYKVYTNAMLVWQCLSPVLRCAHKYHVCMVVFLPWLCEAWTCIICAWQWPSTMWGSHMCHICMAVFLLVLWGSHMCQVCMTVPLTSSARCTQMPYLYGNVPFLLCEACTCSIFALQCPSTIVLGGYVPCLHES